jgi:hypothetical protein
MLNIKDLKPGNKGGTPTRNRPKPNSVEEGM